MTLPTPDFVLRSSYADEPLTHSWDDSDPQFAWLSEDERLQKRIGQATHRGVLALAAGIAEWVAFRFSKHSDAPMLSDKIEAVWAGIVDWRYRADRRMPLHAAWQGPVRGPLWEAAKLLDQMLDLTQRKTFASPEAVNLSQLMMYVTARPGPFKDWRSFAITRLAKLYPVDPADRLGAPVPREALDPDIEYDVSMAPASIDRFLRGLDPARNPWLASPADMVAAGFSGTPYT